MTFELPIATAATDDFKQWFKDIVVGNLFDVFREIIEDDGDEVTPAMCLVATGEAPQLAITQVDISTMEAKQQVIEMQVHYASILEAVSGALLIFEAWTREQDPGQPLPRGSIKGLPGVSETLFISAMHGTQQLICKCPIVRDGDKRKVTMGEPIDPTVQIMSGVFILSAGRAH